MKKILLVLVGGTICTAVNDRGTLSVSEHAGAMLKENFLKSDSAFAHDVKIDLTENLYILSENMTVEKWNLIADTLRRYTGTQKYDGIIFAHGTDTLAYSAALFSLILNNTDVPVFFVSSNERLDSPRANGNANFAYAVECICRGIRPNVYVTYRNITDGVMYLHLGSRLRQCSNYSEDFFSEGAIEIADDSDEAFEKCFAELEKRYPRRKLPKAVISADNWRISDCVLYLSPYVGINYDAYRYEAFKAVLHGAYHSGTACAEKSENCSEYGRNSMLHMIDLCAGKDVDLYFSPSRLDGEIYDTVRILGDHEVCGKKIRFLYGTTNEMAYIKLLAAYSVYNDKADIDAFLNTEFNYEFIFPKQDS